MRNRKRAQTIFIMILCLFVMTGCEPTPTPTDVTPTPTATESTTTQPPSGSVLYPAGHGQLLVKGEFDHLVYSRLLEAGIDSEASESTEPEIMLPEGGYVVTVYLSDTSVYVANVMVEDQVSSVVSPISKPRSFERILESVWDTVVPLGGGRYLTYGSGGPEFGVPGQKTLEPFFEYGEVWSACPTNDGKVLVFGDAGLKAYDPTKHQVSLFKSDMLNLDLGMVASIYEAARCVDATTQFEHDGGLARVGLSGTELIEWPYYPAYYASGRNGSHLSDAALNTVVVITGNDHAMQADEKIDPVKLEPSMLVVADRDLHVHSTIALGFRDDITDVRLSPNGSRVVVQFDEFISVFDTVTTDLLYTTPAWWSSFFWVDENRFIYNGEPGTGNILEANVDRRESYGLNRDMDVFNPDIAGLFDGFLYVTGSDWAEIEEFEAADRRGYRIAID